mmetsp:Transcript_17992/g.40288  ORF Transcript_17992/g.40288 Transcript_17992/m.40288 type:complete len:319 (-) Transcript_17992:7-963(-)
MAPERARMPPWHGAFRSVSLRHLSAFQPPSSLQLAARKRRGFKLAACQEDAFDAVAIVQQPPVVAPQAEPFSSRPQTCEPEICAGAEEDGDLHRPIQRPQTVPCRYRPSSAGIRPASVQRSRPPRAVRPRQAAAVRRRSGSPAPDMRKAAEGAASGITVQPESARRNDEATQGNAEGAPSFNKAASVRPTSGSIKPKLEEEANVSRPLTPRPPSSHFLHSCNARCARPRWPKGRPWGGRPESRPCPHLDKALAPFQPASGEVEPNVLHMSTRQAKLPVARNAKMAGLDHTVLHRYNAYTTTTAKYLTWNPQWVLGAGG